MTVKAYGHNAEKGIKNTQTRIKQLEKKLSVTDSESEIHFLNNSENTDFTVTPEVWQLLKNTINFSQITDGALNPCLFPVTKEWGFTEKKYRIPSEEKIKSLLPLTDWKSLTFSEENKLFKKKGMAFDLGAVGKGYAGDMAILELKKAGVTSAILDLGGNIQCIGTKPDGKEWQIGLRNPWGENPVAAIKINNKAVITSGGYERFFTTDDGKKFIHIFDGKTGFPVNNGLASVTIIAESGYTGDALSTAIFVMGKEKAINFWKNQNLDFGMILIGDDHSICYTKNIEGIIQLLTDFKTTEIIDK